VKVEGLSRIGSKLENLSFFYQAPFARGWCEEGGGASAHGAERRRVDEIRRLRAVPAPQGRRSTGQCDRDTVTRGRCFEKKKFERHGLSNRRKPELKSLRPAWARVLSEL